MAYPQCEDCYEWRVHHQAGVPTQCSGYAHTKAYPHHPPPDHHAGYAYTMAYPASPALRHSAGYARPQAYPHFLGSKFVVPLSLTPKGDHFAPYQYSIIFTQNLFTLLVPVRKLP